LISGAKREMHNNKKYYKSLTEFFPSTNPSPYENQIELVLILDKIGFKKNIS